MKNERLRGLPAAIRRGLTVGWIGGFLVGLYTASQVLGFSFWLALLNLLEAVATGLGIGLAIAVVGWGLGQIPALGQHRWGGLVALLVATAPWLALAGYVLNRWLGIRPSQLLSQKALTPNIILILVATFAAVWISRGLGKPQVRWSWRLLGASLSLVLVLLGLRFTVFGPGQEKARDDVLILLVDALRADRLGAYGYSRETSPAIDRLAADGVRFESAIAASTFTKSSVASLFTGQYPYEHGVYWGVWNDPSGGAHSDVLPDSAVTLAEAFRHRGYLTEAWVQNSHLLAAFGFDQGFVRYRDQQGHAQRINRLFRRFLDRGGNRYPYLAYLHYIDLHAPYRPPAAYRRLFGASGQGYRGIDTEKWGQYLADVRSGTVKVEAERLEEFGNLYDAQIRAVDDEIGALLEDLRKRGRYDDTLIVLTADHGDAFGEHGVISHSTGPYDELVRVPWIVKLPGNRMAGHVVSDQVSLVDVFPTLLDAVGINDVTAVSGCSRFPELRGASRPAGECDVAISEIAEVEGAEATLGLRTERWKYLRFDGGREELYDLQSDPGEQRNLLLEIPDVLELSDFQVVVDFRRRAEEILAARNTSRGRVEVDALTLEELRSLGYVK
ncbi:MAG: sulfatase-like hydrolase/transferase [Thermoanaerobaculia bacterium]|nr:sulfatase-like hydrolase/transferase [Thermoanaerobaculia bacterium]